MINKIIFQVVSPLPTVNTEALSYYEMLAQCVAKINECIDAINELTGD